MRSCLFGMPGRILVNTTSPMMSKNMMGMLATLFFTCLALFSVSLSFSSPCMAYAVLPPERLFNHCRCLCLQFSEICSNCNAVTLLDPSRNRIRPDTRLQIKGRKESAHPISCLKFYTLTPKIRQYYHEPLHSATTTVVQMASRDSEIMDTSTCARARVCVCVSMYLFLFVLAFAKLWL
jgi:hypothetical protein